MVGSGLWASCTSDVLGSDVGVATTFTPPVSSSRTSALRRAVLERPKRTGSPWTSGMIASALVSGDLMASKAPSLKIGQFW